MKNKLMILLIIVLLTSFATAFEMNLGGLQDNPVPAQQSIPSSDFDFTDLLTDDTPEPIVKVATPTTLQEPIIDITSQLDNTLEYTLPEPSIDIVIDTDIDELGLAGQLDDNNFEMDLAAGLEDSLELGFTNKLQDQFDMLVAGLKDPKKVLDKTIGIINADKKEVGHFITELRKTGKKFDFKIHLITIEENQTVWTGPIKEIIIKGHDENSPNNLLKIEQNLPSNITPFKSGGNFAIDPTEINFTEMTLTFKATGNTLYKCKDWNFTTKTCAPVQRECTKGKGEKNETCTITGGWTEILAMNPGQEYSIQISPEDPAFAQYNSTLGAPECAGGESPCIATSALLMSRDSLATAEPNQPNTIDACTDGTSGVYLTDESAENITVTSLNGTHFRVGDTINVTGSFLCWNTVNDNLNFVYTSNLSNLSSVPWSVKAFTDPCPTARPNFYTTTHSWTLDNNIGKHAVRIINQYNGATTTTCGAGAYDDNDDLAFRVYSRVPPNVTNVTPVANTTYDVNDTINITAKVEDSEGIDYVKANITLPNGTIITINLSRKIIGEVMKNKTINGSWRTINFTNHYDEPAVFASPLSFRNLRPAEVRIVNVTSTSFTVRAQEPTGSFPEPDNHSDEWPISILVLETGTHQLTDGTYIEVHKNISSTTASGTGPDTWTTYSYDINWSTTTPVVLSQIQTYNSARFVTTTKRNVGAATFQMSMEVGQDNSSQHPNETIAWMAITPTTSTSNSTMNGLLYSSVLSADSIRGYTNGCYAAAHGLGVIPAAVVGMQTTRDGGHGGWARYCTQTSTWTSANTYWTIDEVDNGERAHTTERVSFIAFNASGNITDSRYWEGVFNITQTRGQYNITIIAADIPGNINDSETTNFRIPTYPNVTLISPANGTIQNTTAATFICNATDYFGLTNITFYLWNSTGGLMQTNTTNVSGKKNQSIINATLLQGIYYWNCLAYTIYDMPAWDEENYTLTIDVNDPIVNISLPVNGTTYNTTLNLPLNYTAVNGVGIDSCWYVLNGGGTVSLPSCLNTTINVSAGQNNLTVYANDTAGNIGNDSVIFFARWATTLFLNETKDPVENGELFYYYADYEYAHNASDVLNATCVMQILNDTEVGYYFLPADNIYRYNATGHWDAIHFENVGRNVYNTNYRIIFHIAYNGTANKNFYAWLTTNKTAWNSSQAPNFTINQTTHPQLNTTLQDIQINVSDSYFPISGNYTLFFGCANCNATEYYFIGEDNDTFGHSYHSNVGAGTTTWSNMSLRNHEYTAELLLGGKLLNMTYNAGNSRYQIASVQYFCKGTNFTYTWRANCTKTNHVPKTNTTTLTVANNYIPQPNITGVAPDPARAYADDVQVNWTNDWTGKAFGITSSYVNLTFPNGTFIQQYTGSPFTISKKKLTKLGNYTLIAFAENNIGSNTSNKTFLVISTAPNVTIIAPLGENYSENTIVVISTNVTDPDGVDTVIASVDTPNGTQHNITLGKSLTSQDFENSSTINTTWIKMQDIGPGQTCTVDINTTIPGRGFANLSGNGLPKTLTICGVSSKKRIDGDFDINLTWYWEAAQQGVDSGVVWSMTESSTANFGNRQIMVYYGNISGVGTAIRVFANDNGTVSVISQVPTYIDNSTVRIVRQGNNFTIYDLNESSGNWTQIPLTKSIWNLSRALHVQTGVASIYPTFSQSAASTDNLNIKSDNTTFGLFNYTNQLGLYNFTIIANDTIGGMNNSEKSNFTIIFRNDPPSKPYILTPNPGDTISGQYNISWIQVIDQENDTLEYNITLLNPNYTFNSTIVSRLSDGNRTKYNWDTTTVPDGIYSIKILVYENNTPEKLSNSDFLIGNFTVINTRPNVTIIAPLNETFGEDTIVVISTNVTDPAGVDTVIASVDTPNATQYNITLGKSLTSQDYENSSTINTTWTKMQDIGPGQTCTVDINTTIPGRGFANLSGNGLPKTLTICGVSSKKRIDGDFDINLTWYWEAAQQGVDSGVVWSMTESNTANFGNRQIMVYYGNISGVGTAIRIYANDNGTVSVISQVPTHIDNSTVRMVRQGNNFTIYDLNESSGNWTQIPLTKSTWNLSRALHVQTGVASIYPTFSQSAASTNNLNIKSDNTTFGLFNYTNQLGLYNFTIIANNTYGQINNSETSNFTIVYINDPPSTPYLLTPDIGQTIGGQFNITWMPVTDPEGHTLQYNITLLNANGSINTSIVTNLGPGNLTSYTWNTTAHNDGVYSMRIVVFENNTPEKLSNAYTLLGTFTINNVKPNVVIIAPLGQTFDQDEIVVISVNATSPAGIKNVTAKVDTPNGTSKTINLENGLQSENFDNSSSMNTTWRKAQNIAGAQTCTVDINTTIPGRGFANLSGNGFPNTLSLCGLGSSKRIDGDFDINTTWYWEEAKQSVDSGIAISFSESKISSFANRQLMVYYGNISGIGTATRIYANDNGTTQVISQINKYLNNNSLRVVRINNTFTIYSWNQSGGNWVQIPTLKPILNLSRALHVQIGVISMYSEYSTAAASMDDLNIISDNLTFGLFNYTNQQGNYNVSITATDNFGGINNSEQTNFSIAYVNDPPSVPFILTPNINDVWALFDYIAWIQVEDEENHTVQFNITLLNPNFTYNTTITSNYGDISTDIYNWNTSTVPDGVYSIKVKVFENATPELLSQSNTLLGNFTVNNYGPKVFNLTPANGSNFPSNSTVLIGANVTDLVGVDKVYINVTLPDNSNQIIYLNYTSGDWYETNFTNTIQDGQYKALFVANDTYGKINNTEFTFFIIPNDAPNITINGPLNGSNYTMNIFNITVNVTATDPNNDTICVKIYASNTTPIDINHSLIYRICASFNSSFEHVIYNWTSPVIQPDNNTMLLLHFDRIEELGENATHMYDYSGHGNNGSCSGASCPVYSTGKLGLATDYDVGKYVAVQDSPTLDGMNELSLEAWIKVNDIDEFEIIDKNQSYDLHLDLTGHVVFKLYSPNQTVVSTSTVNIDEWHMIQATYNGSEMKIYFDGVLENTTNRTGVVANTPGPLVIGLDAGDLASNGFDGIIDQVVMHNKSLPWKTVRNHYRLNQGTWYWYAYATDSINTTTSALYHININPSIKLINISPATGQTFYLNETVLFTYNASAALGIDKVRCDITLPNGTIIQLKLNNTSGSTYEANFTNLWLRGTYNYTCYANDTINDEITAFTSQFRRTAPAGRIIDIITGNMTKNIYLDYTTAVLQNTSGILKLNITINSTRVPRMIVYNHSENSMYSIIRLSDYTKEDNESFADDGFAINLTGINMTYANLTAYTDGNNLLKCTNFSWTNLTCNDDFDYEYVKAVQNGTTYNIILDTTDPSFVTTITGPANINDSALRQNRANTNYGALTMMRVGRGPGANSNFRPIIQFNLTGIPAGATINSAKLELYFYRIVGTDNTSNRTYNVHRVQQNPARNWTELGTTWNNYTSANAWTAGGGDFLGTPTDSITFDNTSLNSFVSWNVTKDVQNFSDVRNLNFGWIIADNQSAARTRRQFRSKNVGNANLRPRLVINYTTHTSLFGAKTNFSDFMFSSSAYVPVFSVLFNTTKNQTDIAMLSSFNLEKTTGTGIDIISVRVLINGGVVLMNGGLTSEDHEIRTAALGEPQSGGIIPVLTNVSNGTHNITVEFKRTGNGNVKIYNIDFSLLELISAHNNTVRGQITPANYQHTTGGTGYPYMFNWTINKTGMLASNTFITSKGTHKSTGVNTAISYKFIDRNTLEESPTWEAITQNISDVHSMSGNWVFLNQQGLVNMTVGSRNYQAGRTTTVNMTLFDVDMMDIQNNTINSFRTTSNLTNWSQALTINSTWTKIVNYSVTLRNGTGLLVAITSTPQLAGGDPNPQNITQRVTITGTGTNCTSEKRLGLFGGLDAGNLYVYTICDNMTVGQTYEVAGWGQAAPGRIYHQYDEALSAFEINPTPVEQIQFDTQPDLEPINLTFSDNNPKENENITITSIIKNNGASTSSILVKFFDGNCTNGTQINGNRTISQLNKTQNTTINVTWLATPIGPHNIWVCVDPNNIINETNETNNNMNNSLNVQAWQLYYGVADGNITLEKQIGAIEYDWTAIDNGTVYIIDIDDVLNFAYLQALGRNVTGGPSTNDFADADINLNMTGFNDSVQILFAVNASSPKQTTTFTIINRDVQFVPYINSTNTSNFITGIMWDTRNDTDGQYGTVDNETLVFVANINRNATGKYGTYDYEIYIPRNLALYSGLTDRIRFYTELR